jgi:hypothetical protein
LFEDVLKTILAFLKTNIIGVKAAKVVGYWKVGFISTFED